MSAMSTQLRFVINTGSFTATSVSIPSAAVAPDNSTSFKSNPERGAGYYSTCDGLHTVTYTVTPNYAGSLCMQASLAAAPTETDWFTVTNTVVTYIYPVVPATTTTNYVNFTGNFIWVRAKVDRSDDDPNGALQFINYNY